MKCKSISTNDKNWHLASESAAKALENISWSEQQAIVENSGTNSR
jgi:hypothetical protein